MCKYFLDHNWIFNTRNHLHFMVYSLNSDSIVLEQVLESLRAQALIEKQKYQ